MKAEEEESFAVQPKWYFTACLFLFIRKAKNNRDFSTMHSTFIRFGNNFPKSHTFAGFAHQLSSTVAWRKASLLFLVVDEHQEDH